MIGCVFFCLYLTGERGRGSAVQCECVCVIDLTRTCAYTNQRWYATEKYEYITFETTQPATYVLI